MSLPVTLLLVAGLLAVVSLMQRLAARLTLPASILFAIMGVVIGGAAMFALRSGMTGAVGNIARAFVDVPVTSDRFLLEMWEQLAYWASSLIFVLAALLVPRLLLDVGSHDVFTLAVMIVAAFAARALVLFGFLPVISTLHLSRQVGHRCNVVILWGGLRGAVTLALALAVTENDAVSHDVHRFVAVLATGFVLFTLLIPGLTLRQFIRWLGLDRLSAYHSHPHRSRGCGSIADEQSGAMSLWRRCQVPAPSPEPHHASPPSLRSSPGGRFER